MANIVSDGLSQVITRNRLAVRNTKDVISVITLVDLIVILPSFIAYILLSLRSLSSIGFQFAVIVTLLLLLLPLAIGLSGVFLSKKVVLSKGEHKGENIAPIILFLLLIFSMFGAYTPIIAKLAILMPSLGSLDTIECSIALFYLLFVVKSVTSLMKD